MAPGLTDENALFATGGSDGCVHLLDRDGNEIALLSGHLDDVDLVAFSPVTDELILVRSFLSLQQHTPAGGRKEVYEARKEGRKYEGSKERRTVTKEKEGRKEGYEERKGGRLRRKEGKEEGRTEGHDGRKEGRQAGRKLAPCLLYAHAL